jgi:membrane-associated protease RseP (regulator of RpoE activity)
MAYLLKGLPFSLFFLAFLTFHEFGHYFTARANQIRCSLPYYIPVPPFLFPSLIGTLGAVIKLKERPASTRVTFDIGIAGPLAGFVVSVFLLIWGFTHLPPLGHYIGSIHPNYSEEFGGIPTEDRLNNSLNYPNSICIGSNLIFEALSWLFVSDRSQLPPSFELMHYPALFAGFLGLFFTALNMLPIGQLDGGHVVFGLFGRKISSIVSRCTVLVLLFLGGAGNFNFFSFSANEGMEYSDWLNGKFISCAIFSAVLVFVLLKMFGNDSWFLSGCIFLGFGAAATGLNYFTGGFESNFIWLFFGIFSVFFIGVDHPPVLFEEKLSKGRILLGWISLAIMLGSFSFSPIRIME